MLKVLSDQPELLKELSAAGEIAEHCLKQGEAAGPRLVKEFFEDILPDGCCDESIKRKALGLVYARIAMRKKRQGEKALAEAVKSAVLDPKWLWDMRLVPVFLEVVIGKSGVNFLRRLRRQFPGV